MRKVKTAGYFIAIILAFVLAVYLFGNHLIFYTVQYGLRKSLPQYEASLKSVRVSDDSLVFYSVQIKNNNININAAQVQILFKPGDLIRGKIERIAVKNVSAQARGSAGKILSDVSFFIAPAKPSGFSLRLGQIEIAPMTIDIQSDVLTLNGSLSLLIDASANKISTLQARIGSAEMGGLSFKNIQMDFDERNAGQLSAESIGYQKLTVSAVRSRLSLDGSILKIEPIHGVTLDGNIDGRFQMRLDGDKAYELDLTLQQLSLPRLISLLKFEDKMSMTGSFLGKIVIRGNSLGVDSIDGSLSGSKSGGDLVIRDEAFLGDIAARMKQPLELVKAGLKEYHYDAGQARLLKNKSDLELDLLLDGPKGKRHLSTVFHEAV